MKENTTPSTTTRYFFPKFSLTQDNLALDNLRALSHPTQSSRSSPSQLKTDGEKIHKRVVRDNHGIGRDT